MKSSYNLWFSDDFGWVKKLTNSLNIRSKVWLESYAKFQTSGGQGNLLSLFILLTQYSLMFHFYTPLVFNVFRGYKNGTLG